MNNKSLFLAAGLFFVFGCGGGGGSDSSGGEQLFNVTITDSATAPIAGGAPIILSTAVIAVHTESSPLFTVGNSAGNSGLEAFAEAADNSTLIQTLQNSGNVELVGVAQTPVGSQSPAFLAPGDSYVITIAAAPGEKLSLGVAFAQANDTLVANSDGGSPLFDANGNPISGEVPMALYDVGTEVNETPGSGPNQLLRQGTNTDGVQENNPITVQTGEGFPAASSFIHVTFTPVN